MRAFLVNDLELAVVVVADKLACRADEIVGELPHPVNCGAKWAIL